MKRTRRCPNNSHEPKTEHLTTYGRTSKSRVKLYFCSFMGLAILWNLRRESSKSHDVLQTKNIKQSISMWLEIKKNISHISGLEAFEDNDSDRKISRLFDNCLTDQVFVNDDAVQLGHVRGRGRAVFTEESWCRQNLNMESVEGEWSGRGLAGVTGLTYTDGRTASGVFRDGAVWGELRTFR